MREPTTVLSPAIELLGDDRREAGIGALAHFKVLGDHRHTIVRRDPQERVRREVFGGGVGQCADQGAGPIKADGEACSGRGRALQESASAPPRSKASPAKRRKPCRPNGPSHNNNHGCDHGAPGQQPVREEAHGRSSGGTARLYHKISPRASPLAEAGNQSPFVAPPTLAEKCSHQFVCVMQS